MRVAVTSLISVLAHGSIVGGRLDDGRAVRVKIREPLGAVVGDVLEVRGTEGRYRDRWGKEHVQIEAACADRVRSSGSLVLPWLGTLKGVGPVRARRLAEAFGQDLADVIADPDALDEIGRAAEPSRASVGRIIAAGIVAEMSARMEADSMAEAELRFRQRLENYGVNDLRAARRLWRLIGSKQAEERLIERPYLAASVLPWADADHLGLRLLALRGDAPDPMNHPERLAGACDAAWRRTLSEGDTACDPGSFRQKLRQLLRHQAAPVDTAKIVEVGLTAGAVVRRGEVLRAPGAAWLEDDLARRLDALGATEGAISFEAGIPAAIVAAQGRSSLELTPEQQEAVSFMLGRQVSVLQGYAGTGKTTVMRVLVDAWEHAGGRVVMACISGKAAVQLSRATSGPGRPRLARTVARTLAGLDADPGRPGSEEIDCRTLLLVDEASMVDTASLHSLVFRMQQGARLALIGDEAQLPPVGFGQVFHDFVKDGRSVVRLTHVLRQGQGSPIPLIAAEIRQGRMPRFDELADTRAGARHVACNEGALLKETLRAWHELGGHLHPGETLVCAALRKTVDAVNEAAVAATGGREVRRRIGPLTWVGVGDPVVATRNHYAAGMLNGQVGTVCAVEEELRVVWDGEEGPTIVPTDLLVDVQLAFAVTCHRAQGSSARRVIVPIEDTRLLTRQWLYTAMTRAREQVVLVGPEAALRRAVERSTKRVTGFLLR